MAKRERSCQKREFRTTVELPIPGTYGKEYPRLLQHPGNAYLQCSHVPSHSLVVCSSGGQADTLVTIEDSDQL